MLFFRGLCSKCLEKREKTLFSHTFCRTSCKKLKKCCFLFHFLRTLYEVSRKTWKKHCFLTLFAGHRAKSSKNAVFFRIFCERCTKCLEKREKTLFFHTFSRTSCKKLKKRCFFAFFANFVRSVSKNEKKHCFLTLFAGHRAKSLKKRCFSHGGQLPLVHHYLLNPSQPCWLGYLAHVYFAEFSGLLWHNCIIRGVLQYIFLNFIYIYIYIYIYTRWN